MTLLAFIFLVWFLTPSVSWNPDPMEVISWLFLAVVIILIRCKNM